MTADLGDPPATHCDSCGDKTATAPVCEDCRAEQITEMTATVADGQQLSLGEAEWLLAEVDRLRDTLTRRGEEYDAARAALDIEYGISRGLAAERDRLAGLTPGELLQVRRTDSVGGPS